MMKPGPIHKDLNTRRRLSSDRRVLCDSTILTDSRHAAVDWANVTCARCLRLEGSRRRGRPSPAESAAALELFR